MSKRHVWTDKSDDGNKLIASCGYELDLKDAKAADEITKAEGNCEKCLKSLRGERDKAEAAHAKQQAKEAKKQAEAEES